MPSVHIVRGRVQGDFVDKETPKGEGIVEIPMDVLKEAVRALGW
jgi:hypothetical protein